MDKNETALLSIAYLSQFYGIDISITSAKKKNTKKTNTIEKLASENGIKLKKKFCDANTLNTKNIYPVIAEFKNDFDGNIEYYCIINKTKNSFDIIYNNNVLRVSNEEFEKKFNGIIYIGKPKNNFSNINSIMNILKFIKLLKPEKKNIMRIFFSSLMLCFFGILLAFYFRFLIDEVLSTGLEKMLHTFIFAYFIIIIFQNLLHFARNQLLNFLAHKIDAIIIVEYFSHIMKLPMNFFSRYKTGEIISRMYDASTIRSLISTTFISVAIDTVMLVFGGTFLAFFGSKLLIISVISVILAAIITKFFAKPYRIKMNERAHAEAKKHSLLVEFINGIENIKSISGIHEAIDKSEERIIKATSKNLNIRTIANFQHTLQNFIQQLGTMAIYWMGGINIINGNMSLGQLISFIIMSQYFIGPLFRFLTLQPTFQEAETAAGRLIEVFDEQIEEQTGMRISEGNLYGNIEFSNVNFSYNNNRTILNNINLNIASGKKIAFVGESGSGKSSTAKLLMKFQNISSGTIKLDGKNIDDYSIEFLRTKIGYVPQEPLLFSGSIAENITFGNGQVSPSEILEAAKLAEADCFIQNLPDRYETSVGERGATLSGGEKQRIAIARILLKNPDIFIFDESTSALDTILENNIIDIINTELKQKTVIMISHKLSAIKNFDDIFVFEHGNIIEHGTHEELLLKKGKYYKLWNAQNKEEQYEKIA